MKISRSLRYYLIIFTFFLVFGIQNDVLAKRYSSHRPYKQYKSTFKSYKSSYKPTKTKSYLYKPKRNSIKSYNKTIKIKTYSTSFQTKEYYKSGFPKERSTSKRNEFLRQRGYEKTPYGYEVDHIIPLCKGGADEPYNMQLMPKFLHKMKTARERAAY